MVNFFECLTVYISLDLKTRFRTHNAELDNSRRERLQHYNLRSSDFANG